MILAGSGLIDAVLAVVETHSSVKYVCADSTDSVVQMFRIIDWIRQGKGMYVAVVAGWAHAHRNRPGFLTGEVYRGHVGVLLVLCCFMFLWTVLQQAEACGKCITDTSLTSGDIKSDARRMLGGSSCADQIQNAEIFKIAQNYCSAQIDLLCSPLSVPTSYAERCLIGACNGLVHSNRFRYLFSLVLQGIEIIVCLLLIFITPDIQAAAGVGGPTLVSPDARVDGDTTRSALQPTTRDRHQFLRNRTSHSSTHLQF